MKPAIKRIVVAVLTPLLTVYRTLRRLSIHRVYDSSAYWRSRAALPDQAAVLWTNQCYNRLYRARQHRILERYLGDLPPGARVLDVGCGIGTVSQMILSIRPDCTIDAVDFSEMIAVARHHVIDRRVTFIDSPAETYLGTEHSYDLVLSSGCYSCIRDISKLETALANGARMLKHNGLMLLIDPFHRWNYLARAKYGTTDVATLLSTHDLELVDKSGVLFWPFREWLCDSSVPDDVLERRFNLGETLLAVMGQHLWADYKVLAFRRSAY